MTGQPEQPVATPCAWCGGLMPQDGSVECPTCRESDQATRMKRLLAWAVVCAQQQIVGLVQSNQLPATVQLACAVMWPMAHKEERFLFVGPQPGQWQIFQSLSPAAKQRMDDGGAFQQWQSLQQLHLQVGFRCGFMVQVEHDAGATGGTGIVLPNGHIPAKRPVRRA